MLVNERVLIIYPSDLFSVEFSSGISTELTCDRKVFHKLVPQYGTNYQIQWKEILKYFKFLQAWWKKTLSKGIEDVRLLLSLYLLWILFSFLLLLWSLLLIIFMLIYIYVFIIVTNTIFNIIINIAIISIITIFALTLSFHKKY